jgi:hypothetical protein
MYSGTEADLNVTQVPNFLQWNSLAINAKNDSLLNTTSTFRRKTCAMRGLGHAHIAHELFLFNFLDVRV